MQRSGSLLGVGHETLSEEDSHLVFVQMVNDFKALGREVKRTEKGKKNM